MGAALEKILAAVGLLDGLFGGIILFLLAAFRWLYRRLKALRHGTVALLRDRIVQSYYYHWDKGYMPIYSRDSLDEMFRQYTALGGNGTVKDIVEKLKMLPYEKRKDDRDVG